MSRFLDEIGAHHLVELTKDEFTNYYNKEEVDALIHDSKEEKQIVIPVESDILENYTQVSTVSALPELPSFDGGTVLYVDYGSDYEQVWGDAADGKYDSDTIMLGNMEEGFLYYENYSSCNREKYAVLENTEDGTIDDYIVFGLKSEVATLSGGDSVTLPIVDVDFQVYSTKPSGSGVTFTHYAFNVAGITGHINVVGGSGDRVGACAYAPGDQGTFTLASARSQTVDVTSIDVLHVYVKDGSQGQLPPTVPKAFITELSPNSFTIYTTNMEGTRESTRYTVTVDVSDARSPFDSFKYVRYSTETLYEKELTTVPKYNEAAKMETAKRDYDHGEFFTGRYNEYGTPIYGKYFYIAPIIRRYNGQGRIEYVYPDGTTTTTFNPIYVIAHNLDIERVYEVIPTWMMQNPNDSSKHLITTGNSFLISDNETTEIHTNLYSYGAVYVDSNDITIYRGVDVFFYDCLALITYTKAA